MKILINDNLPVLPHRNARFSSWDEESTYERPQKQTEPSPGSVITRCKAMYLLSKNVFISIINLFVFVFRPVFSKLQVAAAV
jgi:hypothetical protein